MILLDGLNLKRTILDNIKKEVANMKDKPSFAILQVGDNEASKIYIKEKIKMSEYLGYTYRYLTYPKTITEKELISEIAKLNNDDEINGIFVQLPLPKGLDTVKICNAIKETKDIDGLNTSNLGKLFQGIPTLLPCTPSGIMELLKAYNINIEGMNATVIGRSNLVGKPIAMMLLSAGATVTICHSKTKDLKEHTINADLIVSATGKPKLITSDMVKDDAIIIDVGITRVDGKLLGDVEFENVSKKASYITPVPGGVGPMTVAMLAKNILTAYKLQKENR